tara:strand:+ start:1301 stop:1636 length:336 start_codon:yes stop_codon:yes gene_type:complete
MRTVNIPAQTISENIQSYINNVGYSVNIVVGVGVMVDGTFMFSVPQQFSSIDIVNVPEVIDPVTQQVMKPAVTDYTDLMAGSPSWDSSKPAGSFSEDDLWYFIDLIRSRTT